MGNAKDPKKDQAVELLQQGVSPAEVARRLGIPPATVRTWKNRLKKKPKSQKSVSPVSGVSKKVKRPETPSIEEQLVDAVEENEELNDWEKVFCLHYTRTFNATASYRRARPECTYYTAGTEGNELLKKPEIRAEVARLKKMRNLHMMASGEDVVERMMQIAFSDMTDFVEWGRVEVPVMGAFGPVEVENPDDPNGPKIPLTKQVNEVRFRESSEIDGTLIAEVKQGRDGASVKTKDSMKALLWLVEYFEQNPNDRYRREYDRRRMEMDILRMKAANEVAAPPEPVNDGFLDALKGAASGSWDAENLDDSQPAWVAEPDEDEDES